MADILLNFTKGQTFESTSDRVFPGGVPGDHQAIRRALEVFFELQSNALSDYVVTVTETKIVVRPEAVFGLVGEKEEDPDDEEDLADLLADVRFAQDVNVKVTIDIDTAVLLIFFGFWFLMTVLRK